jgi:hypothetical protein
MTIPTKPSATNLLDQIATRARCTPEQAKGVLDSFGVNLHATVPTPRSITLRRLKFSGVKAGTAWDGPFDTEFEFETGVTALVTEANLRGKSTVLELLTWLLRGTPRRLRSDVRPWLHVVTLEYAINGVPLATRLSDHDGAFRADVWTADDALSLEQAVDAGYASSAIRVLAGGLDEVEFAAYQQAMMLERMSLEPITNWQKFPGSEDGRPQVNGWPAYFGAIYLPDANSDVLLGDVAMAGLPARLLQLFCNVPLMSAYIKCRTLQRQVGQDEASHSRRAAEDAAARMQQRKELLAEQQRLLEALEGLADANGRTAETVRGELVAADQAYSRTAAEHRAAREQLAEATEARQTELRHRNNETESAIARILFHGLSPKHCPRCENPIGTERAIAEKDDHECAVCTTVITLDDMGGVEMSSHTGDEQESDALTGYAEDGPATDALEALIAAEDSARAAEKVFAAAFRTAEDRIGVLTNELKNLQASTTFKQRRELELELADVNGQLKSTAANSSASPPSTTLAVLNAATIVLGEVTSDGAGNIFDQLNGEIAELGRAFGIDNLDRVQLNRSGGMRVTTAGVDENFGRLSGGERLRLRISVLIALLRVGHRSGIGTHPGLILLDSPGSEELATADERRLIGELDALKQEIPSLQVCITSAEANAVAGVIDDKRIYAVAGAEPLW